MIRSKPIAIRCAACGGITRSTIGDLIEKPTLACAACAAILDDQLAEAKQRYAGLDERLDRIGDWLDALESGNDPLKRGH